VFTVRSELRCLKIILVILVFKGLVAFENSSCLCRIKHAFTIRTVHVDFKIRSPRGSPDHRSSFKSLLRSPGAGSAADVSKTGSVHVT
jgi:hypothetical protein